MLGQGSVRARSASEGSGRERRKEGLDSRYFQTHAGHGPWSLKHRLRMQDTSLVKASSQVSIFTVIFFKPRDIFLMTLP